MKTTSTIRNATIWLACLGFLSPTTVFGAQPTGPVAKTTAPVVQDVAMDAASTLSGQLVNSQGLRLANAPVVIQSKTQETLRTVTDGEGRFQVTNLRGGVYQVAAGGTSGVYRLWSAAVAPPSATKGLLLVDTQATVRGQCASGACGGDVGGYAGDYGAPVSYGGDACGAPVAYEDTCGGGCGGGCGGACGGGFGGGAGGFLGGGGGGILGLLSNPWVIGAGVAAAIAIPLALDDDDAS